ncbi:MAG: hypothetical protein KKF52_05055 [Nanoarchaeota archaeon]|nr:hypothetical protein [Nanoarchaeota archaeon]MBU4348293.1 hypothetical protein [Patescibacteria group bacterium]
MTTTTLDTNIFLYSIISETCAKKVESTYKKSNFNIVLRTVYYETRPKLLELSSIFSVLLSEISKTRNYLKLIDSNFYDVFKSKYPQIYASFRNFILKNKIGMKERPYLISVVTNILDDIASIIQMISSPKIIYPSEDNEKNILESREFEFANKKLSKIISNKNDLVHLSLCYCYVSINLKHKNQIFFVTLDKKHFLKNKETIEKEIKNLIIQSMPKLDIENIKLKII